MIDGEADNVRNTISCLPTADPAPLHSLDWCVGYTVVVVDLISWSVLSLYLHKSAIATPQPAETHSRAFDVL
jgi:hypothetical protein